MKWLCCFDLKFDGDQSKTKDEKGQHLPVLSNKSYCDDSDVFLISLFRLSSYQIYKTSRVWKELITKIVLSVIKGIYFQVISDFSKTALENSSVDVCRGGIVVFLWDYFFFPAVSPAPALNLKKMMSPSPTV